VGIRQYRALLVAFCPEFAIYPAEVAHLRPTLETAMVKAWHLEQKFRRAFDKFSATIRAIAHALVVEHALALRAATKAASPRKGQAEVRVLYLPPLDPQQGHADRPAYGRGGELQSSSVSNSPSPRPARGRTVDHARYEGEQS